MLWRAHLYALDTKLDRWQFALELEEFRRAGVSISELRWLLASGFAAHARELVSISTEARRFAPLQRHIITSDACLILSERGVRLIERMPELRQKAFLGHQEKKILAIIRSNGDVLPNPPQPGSIVPTCVPRWDPELRELRFQEKLVKALPKSANNQLLILAAFQEESWNRRIDDPLPPAACLDARRRLHDTIKQLNRRQRNSLLRFGGDGTGKGVVWKPVA